MKHDWRMTLWHRMVGSGLYRRCLRPWLDRHPAFKERWRQRLLQPLAPHLIPAVVPAAPVLPAVQPPCDAPAEFSALQAHGSDASHPEWAPWEAALQRARQRLLESQARP